MRSKLKMSLLASLIATLTAVGVVIKVPMIPVPFTLQTFFVLLSGNLLGPYWGAISMVVYILLGLIGLPVFAGGSGVGIVLSPTFGYLIGFPITAYFVGRKRELAHIEPQKKAGIHLFFYQVLGLMIIYFCGVMYLFLLKNVYGGESFPLKQAVFVGFIVFIPSLIIKSILVTVTVLRLKSLLKRFT
jgi:biotin transport system substrate-specific component